MNAAEQVLANLGMVVLDRQGRPLSPSTAWFEELFPQGAPGSSAFLEYFWEQAEEHWKSAQPGVLRDGPFQEGPYQLTCQAHPGGLLVLCCDPQSTQEMHKVLQAAREHSLIHEQLQREIGKKELLLHCIVHDLTGPLTTIKGAAYIMRARGQDEAIRDKTLGMIERSGDRLLEMVGEVLDTFKAEMESLQANSRPPSQSLDLVALAQTLVDSMRAAFEASRLELRRVGEAGPLPVLADPSKLERVLTNYLENALRHAPAGSQVDLRVVREGSELLAAVEDQGQGIAPEKQGRLFQKFAQGQGGGKAGLGLYFCRLTIEGWGGRVGYSLRPQGGSSFWLRLPAR